MSDLTKTPVLPCWYCEGRDEDGPFNSKVTQGWICEACDERREFRTQLAQANARAEAAEKAEEETAALYQDIGQKLCEECDRTDALRTALTRASAELRHATRGRKYHNNDETSPRRVYNCDLIDRAIRILEEATTPHDP